MMTRWVLERGDRNRRLSQLKMRRGEKKREREREKRKEMFEKRLDQTASLVLRLMGPESRQRVGGVAAAK